MSRRVLTAAVFVLAALPLLATGCTFSKPASLKGKTIAAVLKEEEGRRNSIALIDLDSFTVERVVQLRSRTFDIAGDVEQRVVMTAQCGGLGEETDDVIGVVEVDQGSKASYIKLPLPNPYDVDVIKGKAQVVHGFVQKMRTCTSVIDVPSGSVTKSSHIPLDATNPGIVGDELFMPVLLDRGNSRLVALTVMRDGSVVETLTILPGIDITVAKDLSENPERIVAFAGLSPARDVEKVWNAFVIERDTGRVVTQRSIKGIGYGIFEACVVGGDVAISDANDNDADHPGRVVRVLDATTLEEKNRFSLKGMPGALAAWGDNLLVIDGHREELLMYRPGATTPAKRVRFGNREVGRGDVFVFPPSP